jgi:hypothetical protein
MKTLQRQNTKREIVKKVRFQKNEVEKGAAVEKERERNAVKGQTTTTTTTTTNQYSNDCYTAATAAATATAATATAATATATFVPTPVPVPANFESSGLISNVNAVNRIDDGGTNEEENVKEPRDAITLSLVE